VGVQPTRVGERPHRSPADGLGLQAEDGARPGEGRPEGADPEDRDLPGLPALGQRGEGGNAGAQLVVVEVGCGARRAVDEVGDADAVGGQLGALIGPKDPGREAGEVQRGPEAVARAGEVEPGLAERSDGLMPQNRTCRPGPTTSGTGLPRVSATRSTPR